MFDLSNDKNGSYKKRRSVRFHNLRRKIEKKIELEEEDKKFYEMELKKKENLSEYNKKYYQ